MPLAATLSCAWSSAKGWLDPISFDTDRRILPSPGSVGVEMEAEMEVEVEPEVEVAHSG